MKTNLILLFALFHFFSTNAQSQLLEGYLVTNEGDTLRGYIQYKNNKWNIQSIRFSKTPTSTPADYPLASFKKMYIKEYDEYFFVQSVDIDKKPIRNDDLETVPAKKIARETILLRLLANGKINLFKYSDENGKIHFFIQKNDKLEELGYVRYFAGGNLGDLRFYIGTLQNLTADCDNVRIIKPDYTERDLLPIITKYNSCFGEVKHYVKEKEKVKISGGIIAGAKLSFYNYNGVDNAFQEGANNTKYNSSVNEVGGLYFDLLSKKSSSFVPGLEVIIQQGGTYKGTSYTNVDTYATYQTKFTYLTAGIYLKSFLIKNRKPSVFARIGVGYNYIIDYKTDAQVFSVSRNIMLRSLSYAEYKYAINLNAGLGLTYSRFITEIRFQQDLFYGDNFTKGNLASISLMVGYKLF